MYQKFEKLEKKNIFINKLALWLFKNNYQQIT